MHKNNFGFLRLFFASLVIVSHSSELIDGNPSRELLYRLTGTITTGTLAVYGFFLISGFLIAKSFDSSSSVGGYLAKRVCRIYPAFLVAYCLCLFAIGPFVGGHLSSLHFTDFVAALLLLTPFLHGAFAGLPHASLDGSMWTIAYEFRCYLLVIPLGLVGMYSKPYALAVLAAALFIIVGLINPQTHISMRAEALIGEPIMMARLLAVFCTGSLFYALRDMIVYQMRFASAAAIALSLTISVPALTAASVSVFGGYLVIWTALGIRNRWMRHINSGTDISYGVYLYAFPIQNLSLYLFPGIAPWAMTMIAIPSAYALGFLSWIYVERRFVRHSFGATRAEL